MTLRYKSATLSVAVPWLFFLSTFIFYVNFLPCHYFCLYGTPFNVHETSMKLALGLALVSMHSVITRLLISFSLPVLQYCTEAERRSRPLLRSRRFPLPSGCVVGTGGGGEAGSAACCIYLVLNILVRRRKMELRPVINFYSSVFCVRMRMCCAVL